MNHYHFCKYNNVEVSDVEYQISDKIFLLYLISTRSRL